MNIDDKKPECTEEQIAEVKLKKPIVQVWVDGRVVAGYPRNGKNDSIGKVLIDVGGERQVLQFAWSAIARSACHGEILIA